MKIISLNGEDIPDGTFYGISKVRGGSREECLQCLSGRFEYAQELEPEPITKIIKNKDGEISEIEGFAYTMIGGNIK
jgi:hypothetical protein